MKLKQITENLKVEQGIVKLERMAKEAEDITADILYTVSEMMKEIPDLNQAMIKSKKQVTTYLDNCEADLLDQLVAHTEMVRGLFNA